MTLKNWTLYQLLTIMGGGVLILVFLALGVFVTANVTTLQERALQERGTVIAALLAKDLVRPLHQTSDLPLDTMLQQASLAVPDLNYLCVMDGRGDILAHTFTTECPRNLLAIWATGSMAPARFETADMPMLNVPAVIGSRKLGTLHAGFSRLGVIAATRQLNIGIGFVFLAASLALLIAVRFAAAKVSRPLQRLEQEVSRFPEKPSGALPPRPAGTREIERLFAGFAEMQRRLQLLENERAATQQRMIHTERLAALGEMAAGLAHEINNPLDGMQECLRYLEADPARSERAVKYYPMLKSGLERISRTMRAMLNFARSGHSVTVEDCPVTTALDSLVLLADVHIAGRKVGLNWTKSNASCVCRCNRESLAQAGLNLVLNAAEAAEGSPTPEVRISVDCDDGWVYIYVEDSGPGVPDELRGRIFEPFFTSKPMGKGTGLGLPVSRELIRAAGGEVTLAPERSALGGAKFIIKVLKVKCEGSANGKAACQHSHCR